MSDSVVQADGAETWTNGRRRTRRGVGTPVRPPPLCTNRMLPLPISGGGRRTGKVTAAKVTGTGPIRIVVRPRNPVPLWP